MAPVSQNMPRHGRSHLFDDRRPAGEMRPQRQAASPCDPDRSARRQPPFNELDGPENDINLISSSLASRGVADYNIIPLVAADTGHQIVADVFLETLEAINCGDHVLLYFSGNASRAVDLLNSVLLRELLDQYSDVAISEIWRADLYALGNRPTAAMRRVQRAGLYGDMVFVRKTNWQAVSRGTIYREH